MVFRGVSVFCLVIFLSGLASATFGVGAACDSLGCYGEDKALILNRSEARELAFVLQNTDEEEMKVKVELVSGSEIARLVDESMEHVVPPDVHTKVNVLVEVPDDAVAGEEYEVGIIVRQVPEEGEGMVQMAMSIGNSFSVRVGGEAEEEGNLLLWGLVVALVLVVLIIVLIVVKRRKSVSQPAGQVMEPELDAQLR